MKEKGSKNFNLANAVKAKSDLLRIGFLNDEDASLLTRHYVESFNIKLALHELLGHGSGVFFRKNKYGRANFNESVIDPTTGQTVCGLLKGIFMIIPHNGVVCCWQSTVVFFSLREQLLDIAREHLLCVVSFMSDILLL